MKYCIQCGKENLLEAKFCSSCGSPCEKVNEARTTPVEDTTAPILNENMPSITTPVTKKTYDIVDKIKSSKWNAFLVKGSELEEYISDGISSKDTGIISRFSKAVRDDNDRRNKRLVELLKQRTYNIDAEYLKHNKTKPKKSIILAVTGRNSGFKEVSSFWTKPIDDNDPEFIELIKA